MCVGAMHTRRSEENSDNSAEERSPKADENAIRASRGGSWGWQHGDRVAGRWSGSLSDGWENDGCGAAEGDEGLGGVWWRRGDGDEGCSGGVERDGWGVGGGDRGVVGDDDGAAAWGEEAGSDGLDGDGGDGWRRGGDGWGCGVADGAGAVWRGLVKIGWLCGDELTGDGQRGGLDDGVGLDSLSEGGWAGADRDVSGNGGDDPDIDCLAGNWSVDGVGDDS